MLCIIRSSTARWSLLAASGILPGLLLRFLAACHRMTPPVTCLTRLRLDAILHDPPPQQHPSQQDRPRRGGARQPSLQDRLETPATRWTSLTRFWPDGTKKHLDLAAGTALWYHPGQSTVPLRWVFLRDPAGRRKTQALLSTDPDPAPSDHPLHLPAAQADGDHVPGGARPSGGPALAPVVGLGDCPYHTRPAGPPQPAHSDRPSSAPGTPPDTAPVHLVRQDQPHLCRCAGARSRYPLDRGHPFFDVALLHRRPESAPSRHPCKSWIPCATQHGLLREREPHPYQPCRPQPVDPATEALNLLCRKTTAKSGIAGRHRQIGWNNGCLLKVLSK